MLEATGNVSVPNPLYSNSNFAEYSYASNDPVACLAKGSFVVPTIGTTLPPKTEASEAAKLEGLRISAVFSIKLVFRLFDQQGVPNESLL